MMDKKLKMEKYIQKKILKSQQFLVYRTAKLCNNMFLSIGGHRYFETFYIM